MSKKVCKKICERCGKEFEATSNYVHFCDECSIIVKEEKRKRNNEARLIAKQNKLLKGVENVDYVIDRWNGLPTTRITGRWFNERHPGRTIEEYIKEFPDAKLVCEKTHNMISENTTKSMNRPEMKKLFSERISGEKNPNAKCNTTEEQRRSVSPFSKSFKGYEGMNDKDKENIISSHLQYDRKDRVTSQIGYWIKRGYSEEDAKKIVSERQKTFTLEKCIEKYGEEEGLKRWKERQEKWSKKIEEKYRNGEFSKAPKSQNSSIYSKCEIEFVNKLLENNDVIDEHETMSYLTTQLKLTNVSEDRCSNRIFMYDFTYRNKIIEFNGDFWHMNPSEYKSDFFNQISKICAKDKWEIDSIKIKCAESYGYKVLTIWESEYKKDKEGTIQKCIDFLTKD